MATQGQMAYLTGASCVCKLATPAWASSDHMVGTWVAPFDGSVLVRPSLYAYTPYVRG